MYDFLECLTYLLSTDFFVMPDSIPAFFICILRSCSGGCSQKGLGLSKQHLPLLVRGGTVALRHSGLWSQVLWEGKYSYQTTNVDLPSILYVLKVCVYIMLYIYPHRPNDRFLSLHSKKFFLVSNSGHLCVFVCVFRSKSSWATHQLGPKPPAWWWQASDPPLFMSSMCELALLLVTQRTAPTLSFRLQLRVRLWGSEQEGIMSLCFNSVIARGEYRHPAFS